MEGKKEGRGGKGVEGVEEGRERREKERKDIKNINVVGNGLQYQQINKLMFQKARDMCRAERREEKRVKRERKDIKQLML